MANPNWFVAKDYLNNKLAQLQANDPKGNWTMETMTKALEEAGYKGDDGLYKHFTEFGMDENVSPNAAFDVSFYLAAKAKQLEALQPGTTWSVNKVYEAITGSGMSVWEHYQQFGSNEGIATSGDFDSTKYISEKTKLLNETQQDGRTDWTVTEVKEAFANAGLSALEHYNLFGKAEFEAAGKAIGDITADPSIAKDPTFNPYTGVQTYATLADTLAAQQAGILAEKYAITSATDTVTVTVEQQAGLADLLAGATPAVTGTASYQLDDTVAAIAGASTTVLTGSAAAYHISDTLANAAAGADGLVNGAGEVAAGVEFGAKAADAGKGTAADVVTTTLKYDDLDGKTADKIVLEKADANAHGKAEIVIDASAHATGLPDFVVDDSNNALKDSTGASGDLTYKFVGTAKADTLTVGKEFAIVDAGAGDDTLTTGAASALTHLIGGAGKDLFDVKATVLGASVTVDFATKAVIIDDFTKGDDSIKMAASHTAGAVTQETFSGTVESMLSTLCKADATSGAITSWFTDGTDSYIVYNMGATDATDNDVIVKLAGVHDLTALTIAGDVITGA